MRAFAALFREDAVFVNEDGHRWVTRPQIELELSARHESLFRASCSSAVETEMSFLAPTVAALQVRWELVRLISPNGSSLPHRSGSCYSFSQLMLVFGGSPWAKILPAALSVVEGTLCPVATDGGALLEPEHRWLRVDVLASGQTPSGVP
jgi:hypothetical protein